MSFQMKPRPESLVPVHIGRLTWTQAIWGLGIWLALFALGSLFISNPFWDETSAAANPNYAHVMYLHGLLIGLAALIVLVACEMFQLHSQGVRMFSLVAALISTVLVSLGGIFDASLQPVHWMWLILHVIGFFLLDAIFIAMLVGFFMELKHPSDTTRSLPFWLAILAGFSLEFAALMGHLAGWILSFGDHPAILGAWARLVGEKLGDFDANLITSHSHEMVVALLALLVAVLAQRFGYTTLQAGAKIVAQVGGWFVVVGTVLMTVIYVVGGVTSAEPPTLFAFGPGGVSGLAGDDLVTGVGVMIGGFLLLLGLIMNKSDKRQALESRGTRYTLGALVWSWLLLVLTMIGAGYYIELNEGYFGAGSSRAPGAMADAIFTFAHQDFAFFMLPGVMVVLLITNLVMHHKEKIIAWGSMIGSLITFIGVLTYVFVTPSMYSLGYIICAIGVAVLFVTLLVFLQGLWQVIAKEDTAISSKE